MRNKVVYPFRSLLSASCTKTGEAGCPRRMTCAEKGIPLPLRSPDIRINPIKRR